MISIFNKCNNISLHQSTIECEILKIQLLFQKLIILIINSFLI